MREKMAKDDSSLGLLAKAAKFFAHPIKNWAELDAKEPEPESAYSKETLKGMIERKRQNDFVRKREFDHLRKIRRREPSINSTRTDRPSFFQSSLPTNPEERSMTLRKIDEIEAQMSNQWWRGKAAEGDVNGGGGAEVAKAASAASGLPSSGPLSSTLLSNTQGHASESKLSSEAVTLPRQSQATELVPPVTGQSDLVEITSGYGAIGAIGAGFSTMRLFPVELADSLADPDLEEAAIRFANGDDAGAEEVLLTALQGQDLQSERVEAWMAALFDLYRATGQQSRFESVALDFADRLGRSAPDWFSTPDLIRRRMAVSPSSPGIALPAASEPIWSAPAQLTTSALTQLQQAFEQGSPPWLLDWRALEAIDPSIQGELNELFSNWCATQVSLVFQGAESLDRALRALTPAGDTRVNPLAWQARMNALRVLNRQDDFDLVALEYCVTFEVSPPSWQKALCACTLEGLNSVYGHRADDLAIEAKSHADDASPAPLLTDGQDLFAEEAAQVDLSGELAGDAAQALAQLDAGKAIGATRLVVSCEHLVRVDFSAAGSLLNWVTTQQASGCDIQFRNVNRIVAAFFNVIGINEIARVVPRST